MTAVINMYIFFLNQIVYPAVIVVLILTVLGNTCFLNSVLQVLRYTPGFLTHLSLLANQISRTDKQKARLARNDPVRLFVVF